MSPYYNGFEIDTELSDDELMKQDLEYDLREKNYNELRDSIQFVLQNQYLNSVLNGLFKNGESLYSMYPRFQEV